MQVPNLLVIDKSSISGRSVGLPKQYDLADEARVC